MVTPRERFQALAGKWFISEPALFSVYCIHDLEENGRIMCGIRSGQGRIEYNPDQVSLMSDPEFEQRMKLELIRLCLRHPYERQPVNCLHKALQMGSDMVISPAYRLPLLGLAKPKDMDLPEGQHYEWYADAVNDLLHEQQKKESKKREANPNAESSSNAQVIEDEPLVEESESGKTEPSANDLESEEGESTENGNDPTDDGEISQMADTQVNSKSEENNQSEASPEGESDEVHSNKEAESIPEEELSTENVEGNEPQGGNLPLNEQGTETLQGGVGGTTSGQGGEQGSVPGSGDVSIEELRKLYENEYTGLWREDEERMEQMKEVLMGVKDWGTLSGQIVAVIQKALEGRIDYRKVLRAFQTSVISTNRTLTRMRPNRRFGFEAMGSKHNLTSRLLVAVDVSGSVSDRAIGKFFRIITNFFKYGVECVDVIQFDAAVGPKVMDLKTGSKEIKATKFEIQGRGGTSFQCVIDYLKEHNNYDGLIFFTDGYAPAPTIDFTTRAKLLWVTETEDDYNKHKEWMRKLGRACFIK